MYQTPGDTLHLWDYWLDNLPILCTLFDDAYIVFFVSLLWLFSALEEIFSLSHGFGEWSYLFIQWCKLITSVICYISGEIDSTSGYDYTH